MERKRRLWPAIRLRLRAIISTTMVIGWTASAVTALVPYLLLSRGSSGAVLGLARWEWMSLHVWTSVGMALFTIGHLLLNRKGVSRAARVVVGADLGRRAGFAPTPSRRRGFAWATVAVSLAVLIAGGFAFAAEGRSQAGSERGGSVAERVVGDPIGGHHGGGMVRAAGRA